MTKEQRERILPIVSAFLTSPDVERNGGWKDGAESLLDGIPVYFPWRDKRYHEYSAFERNGYFVIYALVSECRCVRPVVMKIKI